jgi:hypothetical protein
MLRRQLPDIKLGTGHQAVPAHCLADSVALTLEQFRSWEILLSCWPVKMSPLLFSFSISQNRDELVGVHSHTLNGSSVLASG